jgi:hypothetical protein
MGCEAGLRQSLRRAILVAYSRRCDAAWRGLSSTSVSSRRPAHRRRTLYVRGWERGGQEWLPPCYRVDTTDAAMWVRRRSDSTVPAGKDTTDRPASEVARQEP